jgi:ribosomal-protein-alanine N-acetyltransferase
VGSAPLRTSGGLCDPDAMRFTLRPALASDIAAMHAIRTAVRENRLSDPLSVTEASYVPLLEGGRGWVAESDGQAVGFAVLDPAAGSVWALFVDSAWEGIGVGRALHDRLLDGAVAGGLDRLWLATGPGSRAERFYERLGWTRAGADGAGDIRLERALPRRGRPPDELVTPRLRLRRARSADLAAMHRVLSDPAAMRYWSTPPHESLEETREWLERMAASSSEESHDFVIERDGELIGKAGCYRLPEIGFILRSDHWRQGLAREALAAVIASSFESYSMAALEADVDPRNAASLALLTGLGFHETRRAKRAWRVGEEWCDSVYLRLDRSGWERSLFRTPASSDEDGAER